MGQTEQPVREYVPFGEGARGNWEHPNMRRSDLVQYKEKENGRIGRTSQIVFGERQHLLRVLDSLEGTHLPIARMQQERRILEELIHARTRELNQINTAWDEKIGLVLSAEAKPEMLEKLTKQAPEEDYYTVAPDQRTSAGECKDFEPPGETSLRSDSGECGAASEFRRGDIDLFKQR